MIDPGQTPLTKREVLTEQRYREAREQYGNGFRAGMGAEAIRELLRELNLKKLQEDLRKDYRETSGQKRVKAIKRLEVVEAFLSVRQSPGVDDSLGCARHRPRIAPDGAAGRRSLCYL